MSKKIAVLITDEFEDSEFTSPADEFRKAGHEVITIEKQAGKTVKGKKGEASVTIDKSIDEVTPAEFDALLLPGGHSPDYLRGDNRFVTFTRDFVNSGKPVFAICHGPQLLISADVIRGRKLTAVNPIIIDVKNAGAEVSYARVDGEAAKKVISGMAGLIPDIGGGSVPGAARVVQAVSASFGRLSSEGGSSSFACSAS